MVEERSGTVNKNEKNVEQNEEKAVCFFIYGAGWGYRVGVANGWGAGGGGVGYFVRVLLHFIYLV